MEAEQVKFFVFRVPREGFSEEEEGGGSRAATRDGRRRRTFFQGLYDDSLKQQSIALWNKGLRHRLEHGRPFMLELPEGDTDLGELLDIGGDGTLGKRGRK